jgi:hypothetical protein
LKEKDKYHFILITSETEDYAEFEEKYYKENITEKEKKKMMYGLQTRIYKEINSKLVKQQIKKDKSKRLQIKIKEFDNLKKIINSFMSKNYPYISYVYGGFREIHEQSLKYNIPLLNHDESCYICKKNRKKNHRKGFFSKLFKNEKTGKNEKIKKENIGVFHSVHTAENFQSEGRKSSTNSERDNKINPQMQRCKTLENKDENIMSKINFIKLESNLKIDLVGDRIIENLNKIENDSSNLLTIVKNNKIKIKLNFLG